MESTWRRPRRRSNGAARSSNIAPEVPSRRFRRRWVLKNRWRGPDVSPGVPSWRMEDGGWRMEDGGWRMEDGRWKMEDGGWKMEDGRWKKEDGEPGAGRK